MTSQPDTLEDCFRQGAEARQAKRKLGDNPYDIETEEHKEWTAGWKATLDLDEDVDPSSTRIDVAETPEGERPDEDPNA